MTAKKKRSILPQAEPAEPAYPTNPRGRRHDPSRRGFLLRVAASGGAVAFAKGIPLVSAQGIEVDFSILDGHDPLGRSGLEVQPEEVGGPMRSAVPSTTVEPETGGSGATSEETTPEDTPPDDGSGVGDLTENRALWVEPGYLLLIQWTRPEDDETPVIQLEASAEVVAAHLASAVTDEHTLHELHSLHTIELGLVDLLTPLVAPATVEVVHLDHDCEAICGPLGPEPEIMLRGSVVAPEY